MRQSLSILLLSAALALSNFACKKNPTEPAEPVPEAGRRDYVWTVDTIKGTPYSDLSRIWGDSPQNVWICGYMDDPMKAWRYDGTSWKPAGIGLGDPNAIFGFGSKNVYAADYSIYHYDGNAWKEEFSASIDGFPGDKDVQFWDMKGLAPNDIWAGGIAWKSNDMYYGALYHFDGNAWSKEYLGKVEREMIIRILPTGEGKKCVVYAVRRSIDYSQDSAVVYEYDGYGKMNKLFIAELRANNRCNIATVGNSIYLMSDKKLYSYSKGSLKFIMTMGDAWVRPIGGRSSNDIFFWLSEGLGHYNGTDFQMLYTFTNNVSIRDRIIVFDKSIFFLGKDYTTGNYYFIKGELKDNKEK